MNVLYFWEPRPGLGLNDHCNPYGPLLAQALAKRGIHLEWTSYGITVEELAARRADFDVLHLNWLQHFYRGGTLAEAVAAYERFAELLTQARKLGYRIVWTLHNRYPHERPHPHLDHLAQLLVCRLAHAVTAHCHYAAGLLRDEFHWDGEVTVVPHGHFIDAFPDSVSRETARERLGIGAGAFVYVFFGNARVYKGVERLVEAFEHIATDDAVLVLMLRSAFDGEYTRLLQDLTGDKARIRVFQSEYFDNAEFQYFTRAADVAVLPFSAILTSGSVITAMGFGLPVVVPGLGCMPELVGEREGVIYDADETDGLQRALVGVRGRGLAEMGRAAREKVESQEWDGIAEQVEALYKGPPSVLQSS